MARVDIVAEHRAAVETLRAQGWDRLERLGLDRAAVERAGFVGLKRVMGTRERQWRPALPQSRSPWAVIVPVFAGRIWRLRDDSDAWASPLIDLLAWLPAAPHPGDGRFLLRRGEGWILGRPALDEAAGEGATTLRVALGLRLFRTPASWAASGADDAGACVCDWRHAEAKALLAVPCIIAEDVAHARELDRELRRLRARHIPRLPQIAVIDAAKEQAA